MRRMLLSLLLLPMLVFALSTECRAENFGRAGLAVLPFTNDEKSTHVQGMDYYDAAKMATVLSDELGNTRRFRLIPFDQIKAVVDAQAYNSGLMTNPLVQLNAGNLLQAQYIIVGDILGEGTKTSGIGYQNSVVGSAKGSKYKVETTVSIRLIDVSTGEILYSAIGKGVSVSTGADFSLNRKKKVAGGTSPTYDEFGNEIGETENFIDEVTTHTITIGTNQVESVQFVNAVENAIKDALHDKDEGLIAKIDGTDKYSRARNKR